MQNGFADMTDFGESSENTVVESSSDIHSFFDRNDMKLGEELIASRAQTEVEEVPAELWFKAVSMERDPSCFESDLPMPACPVIANTNSPQSVAPPSLEESKRVSSCPSPTGSLPIALESSLRYQLPFPTPAVELREVKRVEAPPPPPRVRSSATPQVSRNLLFSALLWEYLGLAISALSCILAFEFINNTGIPASGTMLFPLYLLCGTTTWFALGLLGRYTWLCPLFSALGFGVLLHFNWQILAAMYGGYALIVSARAMLPTGGLLQTLAT